MKRTLPNYKNYPIGEQMYLSIEALLQMFYIYRPDIGYIQGMSFLIVMLFYYYEEIECFVLFCNLILTKKLLHSCYTFDMKALDIYKSIFNDKINRKCPKVKKVLDEFGINTETFILDWLFTLYTRSFNVRLARVFWDIYLVFGDYYLIRIAYSIFSLLKKQLENKDNMEDGLKFIRSQTGSLKLDKIIKHTLRERKTHSDVIKMYQDIRNGLSAAAKLP